MKRLAPNSRRVEGLFRGWHGREPITVKNPESFFPGLELPRRLYPRGGLMRISYESDKATPEGPSGVWDSYIHCNVIEETDRRARRATRPNRGFFASLFGGGNVAETVCVCGHKEHDELPSSLATVYDGDGACTDTEWPEREPIEVEWPRHAVFLGYVKDWDELRSPLESEDPYVYEVRCQKEGWLIALDERTAAVLRADGKVYVAHGGQFRVDARGLIG